MKKFNILLVLLTTLFIGACSSDSEAPKEKFSANGESFNLKNAKVYITNSNNYSNSHGDFIYRDYMVTDGTYASGNGWQLSNYTDATFYLAFEVLIPVGENYLPGTYPSAYIFSNITSSSIYFYGETTVANKFYETTGESEGFVVSGGMEDGETMAIKFNGGLQHWTSIEGMWTAQEFTGSIFVKATVEDVRL